MTKKKSNPKEADSIPFEQALAELEALVETMEQGDLTLEESLKSFERGIALTRRCQESLQAAEQKVTMLSRASADAETEPFEP
ncbi:MAG: exodeoxyribonuclease VII small subunit [Pseudomonadota bacterium]